MSTETKARQSGEKPRPDETEITSRLQEQVLDLEAAVTAAKREAVQLFKELDTRMRRAKSLVSDLDTGGNAWARKVSKIMDLLGDCRGTMEGMVAIGLLKDAGFSWDLEKVFDGNENDQVPG
jgi:exonuclease VII small subunit